MGPLVAGARERSRRPAAIAAITANAIRRCVGFGAVTPCSITLGESAGNALAARTSLPGPNAGPYHAALASTAKRNASRQSPRARGVRRKAREAADDSDIIAVYHAVRSGRAPARAHITVNLRSACAETLWDIEIRRPKHRKMPRRRDRIFHDYRSRPLDPPPLPLRAV